MEIQIKSTMMNDKQQNRMQKKADEELKHCDKCNGLHECKNSTNGHRLTITNAYGDSTPVEQLVRCKYETLRLSEIRMNKARISSGLGKRFRTRTFDSFNPKGNQEAYNTAYDYAFKFTKDTAAGLIFKGKVGTGKTHLAAAIILYLLEKDYDPIFIPITEAETSYSSSWQNGDTRTIVEQLCNINILVLDDLGKEKSSDSMRSFIHQIINARYEKALPTIITTNLNSKMIEERYGEALFSRLSEMCKIITMTGEDYRLSMIQ